MANGIKLQRTDGKFQLWQGNDSGHAIVLLYDANGNALLTTANPGVIQGVAAHDAAVSGNPVQMGGVYRASDPAVTDGDVASLRVNAKGEAIVSLTGSTISQNVLLQELALAFDAANTGFDNAGSATTIGTAANANDELIIPVDKSKYKNCGLYVLNGFDVSMTVALWLTTTLDTGHTAYKRFKQVFSEAVVSGANKYFSSADYPILRDPGVGMVVVVTSPTPAATSGTITLRFWGGDLA